MKQAAVLLLMLSITATQSSAQSEADMKAMQEYMTPGPMHQWMARHAGTWEAEINSWMGPGEPMKSKATEVVTITMNGLYQLSHLTGNIMGMAFEGRGTMAYDNAKKQFVLCWIDNFSSGIIMMTGWYDEPTKTLHFKGTQTNPVTGKDSKLRQEQKFITDDHYILTMYGEGPDGNEMKMMEGHFKKKQ